MKILWRLFEWWACRLLDRGRAQKYIRECRDIHVLWVKYLRRNPNFDSSQVGDEAFHCKWIYRYNRVLRSLMGWL